MMSTVPRVSAREHSEHTIHGRRKAGWSLSVYDYPVMRMMVKLIVLGLMLATVPVGAEDVATLDGSRELTQEKWGWGGINTYGMHLTIHSLLNSLIVNFTH